MPVLTPPPAAPAPRLAARLCTVSVAVSDGRQSRMCLGRPANIFVGSFRVTVAVYPLEARSAAAASPPRAPAPALCADNHLTLLSSP